MNTPTPTITPAAASGTAPKARWEWSRPAGHDDQPIVEWWVEQVAVMIATTIGRRAHRRGDQQTLRRMLALVRAGKTAMLDATAKADA